MLKKKRKEHKSKCGGRWKSIAKKQMKVFDPVLAMLNNTGMDANQLEKPINEKEAKMLNDII